MNHFSINDNWYLVDLPGYGYAKTSKNREQLKNIVVDYLVNRKNLNLQGLFIGQPTKLKNRSEFINWMGINELPFYYINKD